MSPLPPLSPDRVLNRQVLFAGQVVDQVTGQAVTAGLQVQLRHATSGQPIAGLALRLVPEEGRFVFSGDPAVTLATLSTAALPLRFTASASSYPAETTLDLPLAVGAGSVQALTLSRSYGDVTVAEWAWQAGLAPHPLRLTLALTPAPVLLRGRVTDAASPFGPLPATVTITAPGGIPPAAAGADGFYAFAALPLVAQLTIKASAAQYNDATRTVVLDYTQPLNICNFALVHS